MSNAYIYDVIRTPRGKGKKDGSLHEVKPIELLKVLYTTLQERHNLNTELVEDVILGCVTAVGDQGACIAKTSSLYAGWSESVSGLTMNRFCGSGLEACNLAAMKVQSGNSNLVVGGGVESMSRVPMMGDGGDWFMNPAVNQGLGFIPQGISADLIATLEGFSREMVDEFAVKSHQKAAKAQSEGKFRKSVIPVHDINGMEILSEDETIRAQSSVEALSGLKPSFAQMGAMGFDATALRKYDTIESINHVHHAGNSSGIVDGACLALIGDENVGRDFGMKPRARFLSIANVCTEPTIMLNGPVPAAQKALKKAGLSVEDIDLFEVNEAFAAVPMKFIKDLGVPEEKLNVNGGAIAMGHPLGATGAMLLGTVLDELEERDLKRGLITLCIGGGMGIATIIERV